MKSLKLCAAGLCVFLGACASFKTLDKGLAAMSGERIETAISVLGIPSQKMDLSATDSVYVWDTRSQVSFAKPRVATSYGTVGMQPFSVQTHYTEIDNIDLHCTIKALTKNGIISEWDYIGNAGCEHYIKRVEGYLEAKNANMPNEKNFKYDTKNEEYKACVDRVIPNTKKTFTGNDSLFETYLEQHCSQKTMGFVKDYAITQIRLHR